MLPFLFFAAACSDDDGQDVSEIKITEVTILNGDTVTVPDSLRFNISIDGVNKDLSTLEVSAFVENGEEVAHESIRTKGRSVTIQDEAFAVPFEANMAEGSKIGIKFEAIDVSGASVSVTRKISLSRPELPSTLYMTIGDEIYAMTQSADNQYEYSVSSESGFPNITSARISTSDTLEQSEFIWTGTSTINLAQIGKATDSEISISYPSYVVSGYVFNTLTFEVTPIGEEFNVKVNGIVLSPSGNVLTSKIAFTEGSEVTIEGIENLDGAWNRDFLSHEDGKFTFLRESGTYEVYYSPKYNYLWITDMTATYPKCLWIVGHGFTCATEWNTDYATGGWDVTDPLRLGYMVKVEDGIYQCSMYLSDQHEWGSFEFEIYSDLLWNKNNVTGGTSVTGDSTGITLSGAGDGIKGLTSTDGFQPGYYTITYNNVTGEFSLERISPWEETGKSGLYVAGVELDKGDGYAYGTVSFEKGQEVTFSGFTDISKAYNRDFFRYEDGKYYFAAETGEWTVQYYDRYDYIWVFNNSLSFPDCIYILGSGRMSCPVYDDQDDSYVWQDVAYNRMAPYYTVAPKIDEGKYQATMSMSTSNYNWRVLLELYSDLVWGQDGVTPLQLSGTSASRFYLDGTYIKGVDEQTDPFVPGYYRFTFTTTDGGVNIEITTAE
jgi:hypothetical protein